MIDFRDILKADCVLSSCKTVSKKASLEAAAELISNSAPQFDARRLLDELLARERLGSTALGEGVAIPHCRSAECTKPKAALLHLSEPVDFDDEPVDLLFVLVVPEEETRVHLDIMGTVVRVFDSETNPDELRHAPNDSDLNEIFQGQIREAFAE